MTWTLKWLGHVKHDNGLEKTVIDDLVSGRRGRSWPALRGTQDIEYTMGMKVHVAGQLTVVESLSGRLWWERHSTRDLLHDSDESMQWTCFPTAFCCPATQWCWVQALDMFPYSPLLCMLATSSIDVLWYDSARFSSIFSAFSCFSFPPFFILLQHILVYPFSCHIHWHLECLLFIWVSTTICDFI